MTSVVVPPLTADWVRSRLAGDFSAALPPDGWFGETLLGENADLMPAAVLIPIVVRASGLTVLLTQRTNHLRDHAGQVSFPGGRCEPHDESAAATALREAEEEIGLDRRLVEPLGFLDTYRTRTGFSVVPVVALVEPGFTLSLNAGEVADAFEVPLAFLMDAANHRRDTRFWKGATRSFHAMPYGERYIWGATAGMLKNMHARLFGP